MEMDYTEEGRRRFYAIVETARNEINNYPSVIRDNMLKVIDDVAKIYEIYAVEHPKCEAGFPLFGTSMVKLLENLDDIGQKSLEAKSKLDNNLINLIPKIEKISEIIKSTNSILFKEAIPRAQKVRLNVSKPASDSEN